MKSCAVLAKQSALKHNYNYSGEMGDTKVDVTARLAHWKVEGLATFTSKRSDLFKINGCSWCLSVERLPLDHIRLSLQALKFPENQPPFVRFVLRVTDANRRPYSSPIYEEVLRTSDVRTYSIGTCPKIPFVISVEFLDIKIYPPNGGVMSSVLPSVDKVQDLATRSSFKSFSHMLDESVHADITIVTSNGKLQAHKAILSTSSPVFHSMFTHNLKEKVSSTIEIKDMTSESCMALLRFLYGSVNHEEFWKHRLALLGAANKYDITDLKDACEESLLEDINADNVFDRLQEASLYMLGKFKRGCFRYLFDFGQIHHVSRKKMRDFLEQADRALVVEMFEKMLVAGVAPFGRDEKVESCEHRVMHCCQGNSLFARRLLSLLDKVCD